MRTLLQKGFNTKRPLLEHLNRMALSKDGTNTNVLALGMYKLHTDLNQTRTSQLPQDYRKTNKRVSFSTAVIPTTSVSRPQLKSNPQGDRVMHNNSQGKKPEVEDHRWSVKLSKNKTSVTACNDSLNAKTLNVKYVCATCDKYVLHDKHDMCVLKSGAKPINRTVASESNKKPRNFTRKLYERVSKTCSWWYSKFTPLGYKWKPKSGNKMRSTVSNTPLSSNSFAARRLSYSSSTLGAVTIKRVYYVEGLNHNLFFVGQFCDADLEVAFRKSTCFICDLKGNDLLTGSHGTDLYSITLQDTNCPNPICLMAKATSSQAWLWHRRLSHLNFDTINLLSKNDIVVGLPKLKFVKDHLCSSCELGKAKRKSFHIKLTPSSKRRWNRTRVEAARTMLSAAKVPLFFWAEAIKTACFTQNRSLVIPRHEKTPYHIINDQKPSVKFFYIFGSVCYIVRDEENLDKMKEKGDECIFVGDGENLDKMKEKGDECIFVGYSTQSRSYRVYNKRTRVIMESIHVNFDELPQMVSAHNSSDPAPTCQKMASVQVSFDPAPECQTMALEHGSLSPGRKCQENVSHGDKTGTTSNELDFLFSLMFDELLNGSSKVVSKSSAVSAADSPYQRQQPTTPLNNHTTPALTCGDKLVSWSSKKQDCISMSSAKAEKVSVSRQMTWYEMFDSSKTGGSCK
nr:Gag-Pol polyprotein [Tanacetum cinerariifolium]